jgi:antitoxin CcdA
MEDVTQKRPLNLSVRGEMIEAARQARINLSGLLERALAVELAQLRGLRWRLENAAALTSYNEHLALHGACFEGRWGE